MMIHGYGIPSGTPKTRDLVYKTFGRPQKISTTTLFNRSTEETREFKVEHYHVHAKFSPRYGPGYYPPVMLLLEPIYTPIQLFNAAKEITAGHSLEFVYDDEGNTIGSRYPFSFMGTPSSPEYRNYTGSWAEITTDGQIVERPPHPAIFRAED